MDIAIPAPEVTQDDLNTWYELQKQLADIKEKEMALRKKIFAAYFTKPREGTNTQPLSDGWVLKGGYEIRRTVDSATLSNLTPELRNRGLPMDNLINYEPKLALAEYRKLDDAQRNIFDQVLVIKIGSPSLEVVLPKKGK